MIAELEKEGWGEKREKMLGPRSERTEAIRKPGGLLITNLQLTENIIRIM